MRFYSHHDVSLLQRTSWNLRGTRLWRLSNLAQDDGLVAVSHRNPFASSIKLKSATNIPAQKTKVISRPKNLVLEHDIR